MFIVCMIDFDFFGKCVLICQDLNVLIENGCIIFEQCIIVLLLMFKCVLEQGVVVMVILYLGCLKEGVWSEVDLLVLVVQCLFELLGCEVLLVCDWVDGVDVQLGQLVLLENCCMNVGEGKDDEVLLKKYVVLCDVFVMDVFGIVYCVQVFIYGVICFVLVVVGGLLLMVELDVLVQVLDVLVKLLLVIVVGSKVSIKLELLVNLVGKVDQLIVGGGIVNIFIVVVGYNVGKFLYELDLLDIVKKIVVDVKVCGVDILLLVDVVIVKQFLFDVVVEVKVVDVVVEDDLILDIGLQIVVQYVQLIEKVGIVVWNGLVGVFEFEVFSKGIEVLVCVIVSLKVFFIVGGGDILVVVDKFDIVGDVSYIFIGGGVFLEFLEGKILLVVVVFDVCGV